jgi:hypothetical protein
MRCDIWYIKIIMEVNIFIIFTALDPQVSCFHKTLEKHGFIPYLCVFAGQIQSLPPFISCMAATILVACQVDREHSQAQ